MKNLYRTLIFYFLPFLMGYSFSTEEISQHGNVLGKRKITEINHEIGYVPKQKKIKTSNIGTVYTLNNKMYTNIVLPLELKKTIFLLLDKKTKSFIGRTCHEWNSIFLDYYNKMNISCRHLNWDKCTNIPSNLLYNININFRILIGLHINLFKGRGNEKDQIIFERICDKLVKTPSVPKDSLILNYPDFIRRHIFINKHNFLQQTLYRSLKKRFEKLSKLMEKNLINYIDNLKEKDESKLLIYQNEISLYLHYMKFINKNDNSNTKRSFNINCSLYDIIKNYNRLTILRNTNGLSNSGKFSSIWAEIIKLDHGPTLNDIRSSIISHFKNLQYNESYHYCKKLLMYAGNLSDIQDWRNTVNVLARSARYGDALYYIQNVINLSKDEVLLKDIRTISYIYAKNNQNQKSLYYCNKIINHPDCGVEDLRIVAYIYSKAEKYDNSIKIYDILMENPSNIILDDIKNISYLYYKVCKYEKSIEFWEQALSQMDENNLILSDLRQSINVFLKNNNFKKAKYYYKKLFKQSSDKVNTNDLRNMGYIYSKIGKDTKATYYYNKLINQKDVTAQDYFNAGASYFSIGEYKNEHKCFNEVVKLVGKDASLLPNIANYTLRLCEIPAFFYNKETSICFGFNII